MQEKMGYHLMTRMIIHYFDEGVLITQIIEPSELGYYLEHYEIMAMRDVTIDRDDYQRRIPTSEMVKTK